MAYDPVVEARHRQERRLNLICLLQNKRPPNYQNGQYHSFAKAVASIAQEAGLDVTAWDPFGNFFPEYVDPEDRAFLVSVLRGEYPLGRRRVTLWYTARDLVALLRDAGVDVSAADELLAANSVCEVR